MSEQTTTPTITKDMTIGEVVNQYPPVADVFLSYGLHCVGCHVNAFETIVQGAMSHGMSEDEVDEMVAEANSYLAQLATSSDTVTVTPKAVEKLKVLAAEEGKESWGLRVEVIAGGCSGFKYNLEFEEKPREKDTIINEGYPVFIDEESMSFLKGARIDFHDGLHGSGFKIDNPNAKNGCGCGKSFS